MISKVFGIRTASCTFTQKRKLFNKAIRPKEHRLGLYKAAISQLLILSGKGANAEAFKYYLHFKKNPKIKSDKALLEAKFAMFISIFSDSSIQLIYDDCRNYHTTILLKTVEATIEEPFLSESINLIWSTLNKGHIRQGLFLERICYLILKAYCQRGDIENVVRHFQSLQDDHGFIPNQKSWNVVITTHARVGDVDGALM